MSALLKNHGSTPVDRQVSVSVDAADLRRAGRLIHNRVSDLESMPGVRAGRRPERAAELAALRNVLAAIEQALA